MKALFIWREESKECTSGLYGVKDDVTFVYNYSDFKTLEINDFEYIFILAELNWNGNLFEGYKIASSIVKEWKDDNKPPSIEFFSFMGRVQLFDFTKDLNKFFVKSFSHHILPISQDFHFTNYSQSKWKYLKKYALTEFGILNRISHSIITLLNKSDSVIRNEAFGIISQLKELVSIIGVEITEFIDSELVEDKTQLLELNRLIIKRVGDIGLSKNNIVKKSSLREKSKKRLLLLEDDSYYAEKITEVLDSQFEVVSFDNGKEALYELENFSLNYSVLVSDLELLNGDGKLDQEVQGIEVVDFVRKEKPHIAWRILTGLPRKGIKELIDVEINNILHKNQLEYFGYDEGMDEFVLELENQANRNVYLIKMKGPETGFWGEKTNQGGEGGKFKRFYYDLLNSYPTIFDSMWVDIYNTMDQVINNPMSINISTTLITPKDARGWLSRENRTLEDKVDQLKKILIHRLVFFINYLPGDLVFYKGNGEKILSNFSFWEGSLPSNPRAYTPVLGFETARVKPTEFVFKGYGELFDKEIEFLKNCNNEFEDFFDKNEDFCYLIDLVHTYIQEDQKAVNPHFTQSYIEQRNNVFEVNYEYSEKVLKLLSLETKKRSPSNSWSMITQLLEKFKYGDKLNELTQFTSLKEDLKNYINVFLSK